MRIWKLLSLLAVGVMVVAIASPAAGQSDPDDPAPASGATFTMDVEVGIQGYAHPYEPLPVIVDLTSDELIVGRIDVTSGGATVRTDIEVPAGSAKQYVLSGAAPGDRRNVTVALVRIVDGEDDVLERQTPRIASPSGELLVGMFGVDGLTTTLRSAGSTPLATDIVPLAISAGALTRGGGPLGYLVVGPGAVSELDDDTVAALSAWVRSGGRVIGSLAALERFAEVGTGDVLDGAPAAVSRFGEGEYVAVASLDALTVDEWSAMLRDVPPIGLIRTENVNVGSANSLIAAATAGREASVPALPWLLGGIALFIVLVGPVNFLLLRRIGKPEWAWMTVPALSLLFVAGFWTIGRSSLRDFTVTTASVIVDDGLRSRATTALVVQVERGGAHEVELPDGWDAAPTAASVGVEAGVSRTDDSGRVIYDFDLEDLGVGAAEAGWDSDAVAVDLAISATGREIVVDATNTAGHDFWAWGIVVDGVASASPEPLPAGESGSVSIRNFGTTSYSYEPLVSAAVQRRLFYVDEFDNADFQVVSSLAAALERDVPGMRRDGIFFFGFADDTATSVSVDGAAGDAVGTVLVVKRGDRDPGALVALGEVRPAVLSVTGASNVEQYGDGRVWAYGAEEMVFGYVLPAGVSGQVAVDPGASQFQQVEVFDWASGAFVSTSWGDDLASYVSAGGEVVVRARPSDSGFFDEGVLLVRYALKWETGS